MELLRAYQEQVRTQALQGYRHACLLWSIRAPYFKKKTKPPELPAILKNDS